ncbi:hypothetical protein GC169_02530 [bacterium]|nr:hypothetical protein [bacterium]
MSDLARVKAAIVRILTDGNERRRYRDLWNSAAFEIGTEISPEAFETSIETLRSAKTILLTTGPTTWVVLAGAAQTIEPTPGNPQRGAKLEKHLMPNLDAWLRQEFVPNLRVGEHHIVRDTSAGGAAGVWTRPDFTVASSRRFRSTNVREVELYGFELKRADNGSVIGVHEALAHTRYVHFAYLVWHVPDRNLSKSFDPIFSQCARHGIGFIHFADPNRFETWITELDPQKASPEPFAVDDFIADRFSADDNDRMRSWLEGE